MYLNISKFSSELEDLSISTKLPEKVKTNAKTGLVCQKVQRLNLRYLIQAHLLRFLTTRPETIFGASFICLSVEHPLSDKFKENEEFISFREKCLKFQESRKDENNKFGFNSGLFVEHPFMKNVKLPIFFANYVLINYGNGAIFGCPGHDERDFDFAKKFNLDIKCIIKNKNDELPYSKSKTNDELTDSEFLNGMKLDQAKEIIIEEITRKKLEGNH